MQDFLKDKKESILDLDFNGKTISTKDIEILFPIFLNKEKHFLLKKV
jgi:hypothetical protein